MQQSVLAKGDHGGTTGSEPGERGRVLLVDDGETNRMIARAMLRRAGFIVDEAFDGAEAVDLVLQHAYAAVLMDVAMPVMDGVEATRAIRQLPAPNCDIPVVALTAHDTPADRMRCLEAGMDDYIAKPLRYAELVQVLDRNARPADEAEAPADKAACCEDAETVDVEGLGKTVVIQCEKLAQLEEDAGPEAMRDLIVMYLGEADRLTAALMAADKSVSAKDRSRWAHSLKSSSASFGARAVELTAAVLEKSYDKGDFTRAELFLRQLPALGELTMQAFAKRGLGRSQ
ncbi:response regulator [Hwanghaeella grinnelliae]|uniref:Response regulator n=1 Tax=Hwanghaeella grinnelliae TaxID=2500179 RepID=A0A3S2Z7I0_9PROT|nr:response regulator [Hwanghaeella grinnelliae]RVU36461.1 response regulator [Hwanghaeella grinnelliae]